MVLLSIIALILRVYNVGCVLAEEGTVIVGSYKYSQIKWHFIVLLLTHKVKWFGYN